MSEDFENSIRKKLSEADIPFDQDAWSKMESLLDAGDNKRPAAWWWWLFLLPLAGGLGWWWLQPSVLKHDAPIAGIVTQKTAEPRPDGTVPSAKKIAPGEKVSYEPASSNNKTGTQNPSSPVHHVPHGTRAGGNNLTKATAQPAGFLLPEKKTGTGKSTKEGIIMPEPIVTAGNGINFLKTKNIDNAYVYTKITNLPEIPVRSSLQPDQINKTARRKINSKGLYFGVTLGPDLNVAPSFNYGNIGFNFGLLAHYYFNQHWFVTTGAVYSKKIYGAAPRDYTPPDNWTPPADLTKIKANCDVLDIPVNLNYTFLQVNNNTLSATLGVSNYLMLKEKYEYLYKSTPARERTIANENRHYLAILNVGALYQHPAGKRLIIGVQPYAKIPLHGVGLGQVKLYSAGVSFQVNLVGKKR